MSVSAAEATPTRLRRVHFIDEVRGFDIILVVLYHMIYTLGFLFGVTWCRQLFLFLSPISPIFSGLFVFLCGISCRLSRSNVKRGSLLLGVSVIISLAMWAFSQWMHQPHLVIWFGILHCLAVCILLFAALRGVFDRIPTWVGLAVCAVLFVLTYHIPTIEGAYFGLSGVWQVDVPTAWIDIPWLYPLGLSYTPSSDYFPLLPWFFCFIGGSFVGNWVKAGNCPAWMYRSHCRPLAVLGTHTLWVYVVHQPILYAVGWVITTLAGLW